MLNKCQAASAILLSGNARKLTCFGYGVAAPLLVGRFLHAALRPVRPLVCSPVSPCQLALIAGVAGGKVYFIEATRPTF